MMKSVFWWRKPEYPEETTDLRQVTVGVDPVGRNPGQLDTGHLDTGHLGTGQLGTHESGKVGQLDTSI